MFSVFSQIVKYESFSSFVVFWFFFFCFVFRNCHHVSLVEVLPVSLPHPFLKLEPTAEQKKKQKTKKKKTWFVSWLSHHYIQILVYTNITIIILGINHKSQWNHNWYKYTRGWEVLHFLLLQTHTHTQKNENKHL